MSDNNKQWSTPVSFDVSNLPSFPTEIFPDWLRQFVNEVTEATQTPVDASGMAALSVLSAALAKKFVIQPYADKAAWTETNNLYTVSIMASGERKSTVHNLFIKPIIDYERSQFTKSLENSADSDTDNPPVIPSRYIVDDVTPEKLIGLLKENGERMAILSSEGGLFELFEGKRYSNTPNLDVYLKSYTGDYLTVDRVNRPTEILNEPILTIGVFVQPTVIQGLPNRLSGRGIWGRFLYSLPLSRRGKRDVSPRRIDTTIQSNYASNIDSMMSFDPKSPIILTLSENAQSILLDFNRKHEESLNDESTNGILPSWSERLPAHLIRVASLIHVAEQLQEGSDSFPNMNTVISHDILQRVLDASSYFESHAAAAFGSIKTDETLEDAKYLLQILIRESQDQYTKQEIWKKTKGKFTKAELLDNAIRILTDRGYIDTKVDDKPIRTGRKPTIIMINPHIRVAQSGTTQTSIEQMKVDTATTSPSTKRKLKGVV